MLRRLIALSTSGVVVALLTSTAAQTPLPPQAPTGSIVVVVAFADGRRTSILVGPHSGSIWTPKFPRVERWTPPAGQAPADDLKFACARLPEGVSVAVSVLRGSPPLDEQPIRTVLVTPRGSVTVDDLREVGIEPVTLTLSDIKIPEMAPPPVGVPSPDLRVTNVSVNAAPIPSYAITLENHSSKAVRTLIITTSGAAVQAGRSGHEGQALIDAGSTYELTLEMARARPAPDGTVSVAPFTRIAIAAVVWTDESYSGSSALAVPELITDSARRAQLGRVVSELMRIRGANAGATPAALRSALNDLPGDAPDDAVADVVAHLPPGATLPDARVRSLVRSAFLSIRKSVIDDLAAFENSPAGAGTFQAWLNTSVERYLRWHDRLGGSTPGVGAPVRPQVMLQDARGLPAVLRVHPR